MTTLSQRLVLLAVLIVATAIIFLYKHSSQIVEQNRSIPASNTIHNNPEVQLQIDDDSDRRVDTVMEHLQQSSSESHRGNNNTNKGRILVFTSKRSGSSFTGAILATNPQIFYMFEPLKLYPLTKIDEEVDMSRVECWDEPLACPLNYLYQCQLKKYFDEAKILRQGEKADHSRQVWFHRIFGKEEADLGIEAEQAPLDEVCKENYTHIAAKIIRGETIESVVPLMESGVKILYLLRDPRGIINSRRTFGTNMSEFTMIRAMLTECAKNDENLIFINKAARDPKLRPLFSKMFRFMRYDDLSRNLSYYAEKMYDFFEIEMPDIVRQFAKLNPRVRTWSIPKSSMLENTDEILNTSSSTNATTKGLEKWQSGLTYFVVKSVQQACKVTMLSLGYNFLQTEDEMTQPFNARGHVPEDLPFVLS